MNWEEQTPNTTNWVEVGPEVTSHTEITPNTQVWDETIPNIKVWNEEPTLLLNNQENILNNTEEWTNEGLPNWR